MTSRLAPGSSNPQYALFLLKLSVATGINEFQYLGWLSANRATLPALFHASDEPDPDAAQVECTFGIWARRRFAGARVAA